MAVALVVAGVLLAACHAGPGPSHGAAEGAAAAEPEQVASFGPSFSTLAADGLGVLWSAWPGVSRFDPATGVLRTFTAADDAAFAAQWRIVTSVRGGVWLVEPGRVRRFDGERFASVLPTPVDFCQVVEGGDGALFGASCDSSGLVRVVYRWADSSWQPVDLDIAGRGGSVDLIGADPSGGLWLWWAQWFGAGDALVHWDEGVWAAFPTVNGMPFVARSVAMAAEGGVWAAAEGGVVRLAHGEAMPLIPDSGLAYLSSMVEAGGALWAAGMAQDPWVASQQGEAESAIVARWDGTSWTRYGPESGLDLVPTNMSPEVSLAASGGELWAAGRQGLYRLDGDRWTNVLPAVAPSFAERVVVTGPDEAWVVNRGALWRLQGGRWSSGPRAGFLETPVVDVAQDPRGALWAATVSGVARFDGDRWRDVVDMATLFASTTDMSGLTSLAVAPDGAVWAMSDARLLRIAAGASVPQIASPQWGELQIAADGTAWVGTSRRGPDGLWTIETPWGKDAANPDCGADLAVAQNEVWAIRRCWAGFGEAGGDELARFDGAHWTVHHDADGRAFGSIAGVAVTPRGSLIVAAESGLLAHDTAGWTLLLPDSYAAVAVGPDDVLWLTDPSGVYRYVP